jgi:hypothetical protein
MKPEIEILLTAIPILISIGLFYLAWRKTTKKQLEKVEMIKTEFNEKLEEFKYSLEKKNISFGIQFEYLHRQRAQAAIDIFKELQELKDICKTNSDSRDLKIKKFKANFRSKMLFYSDEFCSSINELIRFLERQNMPIHASENDAALIEKINKEIEEKISLLTAKIEQNIKSILYSDNHFTV